MGGRGSSFLAPSSGKWSGSIGPDVSNTLKNAIGSKGAPKAISDAVVETNPYHSYDYREYSQNCQRCVVAYELRRRGYDVTALPTYQGDRLPQVAHYDSKSGTYRGHWQGAFQNAKPVNVGVTGDSTRAEKKVMGNIDQHMKDWGSGARAVVQIFYRGGGGHVFNVENQNGRTVYVEAQTGKVKDMARTMQSVKTDSVNLIRTDNLKISERAKNFVRQSNKR